MQRHRYYEEGEREKRSHVDHFSRECGECLVARRGPSYDRDGYPHMTLERGNPPSPRDPRVGLEVSVPIRNRKNRVGSAT